MDSDEPSGGPGEDDDPMRSPYAPKRTRSVRAAPRADSAETGEVPRFLLGADRPQSDSEESGPGFRRGVSPGDRLVRFDEQEGSVERQAEPNSGDQPSEPATALRATRETDRDETAAPVSPLGLQAPSKAQPASRDAGATEDKASGDQDVERLEASLRWLRRQTADLHRPHADPLIAPRLGRESAGGVGETSGIGRSLEPEHLVAPALMRAQRRNLDGPLSTLRGPLLILIVGLIALPAAYFAAGRPTPPPEPVPEPSLVAVDSEAVALPPAAPQREQKLSAVEPQAVVVPPVTPPQNEASPGKGNGPDPVASSRERISAKAGTAPPASVSSVPPAQDKPITTPSENRSEAQKPAAPPSRRLDPAVVDLLIKQGEQFMANGDVAAARVVFRRAAEAGNAGAALSMGTTYDPIVLKKIGAVGVTADPEKARSWYERAKEFGSPEAPRRIEMLANR